MQLERIILVTLLINATNYNNTQKIAFVKPPRGIGYIFGFTVFACLTHKLNRQFKVILIRASCSVINQLPVSVALEKGQSIGHP